MAAENSRARLPSGPYWYENLSEGNFQKLCQTLLVQEFPKVTSYPVGQKDGGRDASRKAAQGGVVYQVKWSKNPPRNVLGWLTTTIEDEADNIRALVRDGVKDYVLLTSVSGTAAKAGSDGVGSGTMDKLDVRLGQFAKEFGLTSMVCWWRDDIDSRVNLLPDSALWHFSDMLSGKDALRFLGRANAEALAQARLGSLLRRVVSAQWSLDVKVKFQQAELDNDDLEDLFVDVKSVVHSARRNIWQSNEAENQSVGGTVAYLARTSSPLTLVRGEPGQGKSTLGQYLCQVYRSEFIPDDAGFQIKRPSMHPAQPRLPFRVDLRDYATWLDGLDPFNEYDAASKRGPRSRGEVERFLAALLGYLTAETVDGTTIRDILDRYPVLLVFDGLDEVAKPDLRQRVVDEIGKFVGRHVHSRPNVVVTTRPNASDLAEPDTNTFEVLTLQKLDPELRTVYLRRWCVARGIVSKNRRALMHTFATRSAEPHIAQLAENPMSLTILLYLLQRHGQSVPSKRTPLYDEYMKTFLNREADKTPTVQQNRDALEEVTAYLGWHLQGLAERDGSAGRLKTVDLRTEIYRYLTTADRDASLVEALFTDVTQRVWVLTSKTQGMFEFDVQPVREFFAARYLAQYAMKPKQDILVDLIARPFWFNTSRFFAGFSNANELGGLVDGQDDALEHGSHPLVERIALWTLLSDGVFSDRAKAQSRAAALMADDLGIRLLTIANGGSEPLPVLSADRGGSALFAKLLAPLAADPNAPLATETLQLAKSLNLPDQPLVAWWLTHARPALAGPGQHAWLANGSVIAAGTRLDPANVDALSLGSDEATEAAVACGVSPVAGSANETKMLAALLSGSLSDVAAPGSGLIADLVNTLTPRHFIRMGRDRENAYATLSSHCDTFPAALRRGEAFNRLKKITPGFQQIRNAMNSARMSTNTVAPWSRSADALRSIYGPCWLAADIAVIGAAIPSGTRRDVGPMIPGEDTFGPRIGYASLVSNTRQHRRNSTWWRSEREQLNTPGDRALWVYALTAVAHAEVVHECISDVIEDVAALDPPTLKSLLGSSSRLGLSLLSRRLPASIISEALPASPAVALIVSHHADSLTSTTSNIAELFTVESAQTFAQFGAAAWPVMRAISTNLTRIQDEEWLEALAAFGGGAAGTGASGPLNAPLSEAILRNSANYPLQWVQIAEMSIASAHLARPLLDVSQDWFED